MNGCKFTCNTKCMKITMMDGHGQRKIYTQYHVHTYSIMYIPAASLHPVTPPVGFLFVHPFSSP